MWCCDVSGSKEKMNRTGWHVNSLVGLLHSDSTRNSMINSCASREYGDKYAAPRNTFCWLWHTQKSVDGWMEKHRATDGIFYLRIGKRLSNRITPSLSDTLAYRLVMDAITIHTCSLYQIFTPQMTPHLSFPSATVSAFYRQLTVLSSLWPSRRRSDVQRPVERNLQLQLLFYFWLIYKLYSRLFIVEKVEACYWNGFYFVDQLMD